MKDSKNGEEIFGPWSPPAELTADEFRLDHMDLKLPDNSTLVDINLSEDLRVARETNARLHRRVQKGERALRVALGKNKAEADLAKDFGIRMEHAKSEARALQSRLWAIESMVGNRVISFALHLFGLVKS